MKLYFFIIVLCILKCGNIHAQTLDCNGIKYIDSIFIPKLTDTIKYGENHTPAGIFQELSMHIY